ncbi:MAG: hypothetical protein CMF55_00105 [Legionellales bacterium]|nr:hypothetical protein [Legionellales bacterium]|tara:strand:- start:724 stop:1869 length:1146 start_codon:yes stop_codon:yes gene_type:complete
MNVFESAWLSLLKQTDEFDRDYDSTDSLYPSAPLENAFKYGNRYFDSLDEMKEYMEGQNIRQQPEYIAGGRQMSLRNYPTDDDDVRYTHSFDPKYLGEKMIEGLSPRELDNYGLGHSWEIEHAGGGRKGLGISRFKPMTTMWKDPEKADKIFFGNNFSDNPEKFDHEGLGKALNHAAEIAESNIDGSKIDESIIRARDLYDTMTGHQTTDLGTGRRINRVDFDHDENTEEKRMEAAADLFDFYRDNTSPAAKHLREEFDEVYFMDLLERILNDSWLNDPKNHVPGFFVTDTNPFSVDKISSMIDGERNVVGVRSKLPSEPKKERGAGQSIDMIPEKFVTEPISPEDLIFYPETGTDLVEQGRIKPRFQDTRPLSERTEFPI